MDEPTSPEAPALLVVVGASGAGKTTLVGLLAALERPGAGCHNLESSWSSSRNECGGHAFGLTK